MFEILGFQIYCLLIYFEIMSFTLTPPPMYLRCIYLHRRYVRCLHENEQDKTKCDRIKETLKHYGCSSWLYVKENKNPNILRHENMFCSDI